MYKIYFQKIVFYSNFKNLNSLNKLLLFHGLGCDALNYKKVFRNNFGKVQILIPVIPGHSNTLIAGQGDPLLNFAKQIFIFLKKNKIQEFSVYTHSMGNIISALLSRFFLKKKNQLLINNEGNILASDASMVTRKTVSFSKDHFVDFGFAKLLERCKNSDSIVVKLWAKSLRNISAINFYKYAISVVYWSDKNLILHWINTFFKKKVYLYGELSGNVDVLCRLKGHRIIVFSATGHFAHFEKKNDLSMIILNEIKKRKK